jgi:hypothetical protein
VPRIAIKREHRDEISTKLSISCFVGHYPFIEGRGVLVVEADGDVYRDIGTG